jgi:hypothetical protein
LFLLTCSFHVLYPFPLSCHATMNCVYCYWTLLTLHTNVFLFLVIKYPPYLFKFIWSLFVLKQELFVTVLSKN